jgi:ketosteroid isomerase-like protein
MTSEKGANRFGRDEGRSCACLRDTGPTMSEGSTTPDLVELTRRQFEAANRQDMDAVMSRCTPDCVYDTSPDGMGLYDGPAAIRAFLSEWWGAFEALALEPENVVDLGHGIVLSVVCQKGRPANSSGRVERREAYVLQWVEDMIRQVTVYTDIEEGRAASDRLAEERR